MSDPHPRTKPSPTRSVSEPDPVIEADLTRPIRPYAISDEFESGKKTDVDESVYSVLGVTPSTSMPAREIEDRLSLSFINEAALCLQDGILRSARDGDIGAIFGFGFPPFTGGPFMLVDRLGAAEVVTRMERLAATHGDRFQPAQILRDHAESGERFRK